MIPRRLKHSRMGLRAPARVLCPGHLKWVRGHACACSWHFRFACSGRIEAHHQRTRGAGGGDEQAVPLCAFHHALLDSPGWSQKRLEAECNVEFAEIAARLWAKSPHGRKYRMARAARGGNG